LTQPDLQEDLHGLSFDVAKSMRYHLYRRKWWDGWNRANRITGALSGSAVVVGTFASNKIVTAIAGLIVAIISICDLVFDFSDRARHADDLYRQFSAMAQEIAGITTPTEGQLAQLRQRRLKIEMEEGPTLDLLERRCSREEALARGLPVDNAWELSVRERRLAQFIFWTPAHR
jgi:hypothetical protein